MKRASRETIRLESRLAQNHINVKRSAAGAVTFCMRLPHDNWHGAMTCGACQLRNL
jgi:hypothetical protein